MTREERLELLKQIEKDTCVCSIESTFLDDAKSCAIRSAIEELEQEPCDDCISRQAVLNLINADWKYEGLESDVENLPPVTPQPKTGHWVDCGERESWYRCSECGRRVWGGANQYCPDCGLKMIKPYESEVKK